MLILLSPAKNLDFEDAQGAPKATKPALIKHANELSQTTRKLTRGQIKTLMGISENLSDLNFERFQAFQTDGRITGAKQAALAFNGDVYQGLDAKTLDADDFAFAQEHVRILSGLYGLLRPLDAIQPYRLEMGSRLKNPRGNNLYEFWGDLIAKELNKTLKGHDDQTIVNLASKEYFTAVDQKTLDAPIVTPVFKEEKDGKLRVMQFYAKRARGLMARWAAQQRVSSVSELKKFKIDGYKFQTDGSDDATWLFTRPQPAPKSAAKKSTKKAKAA